MITVLSVPAPLAVRMPQGTLIPFCAQSSKCNPAGFFAQSTASFETNAVNHTKVHKGRVLDALIVVFGPGKTVCGRQYLQYVRAIARLTIPALHFSRSRYKKMPNGYPIERSVRI